MSGASWRGMSTLQFVCLYANGNPFIWHKVSTTVHFNIAPTVVVLAWHSESRPAIQIKCTQEANLGLGQRTGLRILAEMPQLEAQSLKPAE